MLEFSAHESETRDVLFLERLDTFMEKSLADIRAFADRELRPFDETRRYVAEWHAKYLFQPSFSFETGHVDADDRSTQVLSALCHTSRILESLCETSGVQSFLLAVDPNEASDQGFLGGSVKGREFWRGMRGGGEAGAKAFKMQFLKHASSGKDGNPDIRQMQDPVNENIPPVIQGSAKSLKLKLYEDVRIALRSASGIRNAEMKWRNPERLDVYGVQLVGWPPDIPAKNPSTLKAVQNKQLLELLSSGSMRFEKTIGSGLYVINDRGSDSQPQEISSGGAIEVDEAEDFSWAYDAEGGGSSPPDQSNLNTIIQSGSSSWDPNIALSSNLMHSSGTSEGNSDRRSTSSLGTEGNETEVPRSKKRARTEAEGG